VFKKTFRCGQEKENINTSWMAPASSKVPNFVPPVPEVDNVWVGYTGFPKKVFEDYYSAKC
jgi:hypothetical protein